MSPHDPPATLPEFPSAPAEQQASDARWKAAIEANGDGVWDWDVPTGRVQFSTNLKRMLGFPADAPWNSLSDWAERVHPDDLPAAMATVQAHFDGRSASYASEHRLRCADGTWKWILDRGLVLTRNASGQPLRMLGSHTDLSGLTAAREALARQQRLFETVLDHAPMGFAVYNATTGESLYVNRQFEHICGVEHGTLSNRRDVFSVIYTDPQERAAAERRVTADLEAAPQAPHAWDDLPLTLKSGEQRWLRSERIPLPEHDLVLSTVQDVTAHHLAANSLQQQATELQQRNAELVRFNRAAVDRELRMLELKQEVNALLARLGERARYGPQS